PYTTLFRSGVVPGVAPELQHDVVRPHAAHQRRRLVRGRHQGAAGGPFQVVAQGGARVGGAGVPGTQVRTQFAPEHLPALHGERVAEVQHRRRSCGRGVHRGRRRAGGGGGGGPLVRGGRRRGRRGRRGAGRRFRLRVPAPAEHHGAQNPTHDPRCAHRATPTTAGERPSGKHTAAEGGRPS